MAIHINNFGVGQKYGTEEGRSLSDAGSMSMGGLTEAISWEIALVDLTETEAVQNDKVIVPTGYRLAGMELHVITASQTGVAIDIGFIASDRNASNSLYTADPNGLVAAVVAAELTPAGIQYRTWGTAANELPAFGSTGAWGAHADGLITATPLLLTASCTTSTLFTAGKIRFVAHFVPASAASNLFRTGLSLATAQN
jgi:hypothetical protein